MLLVTSAGSGITTQPGRKADKSGTDALHVCISPAVQGIAMCYFWQAHALHLSLTNQSATFSGLRPTEERGEPVP